jgi:DNA-binding NarL/FixJ family response regulator
VLLDLNLPDGLGTAVLAQIRGEHLSVKVAVISGTSDDALLSEVERLGADGARTTPYGAAGSLAAIPLWFYYSAQILYFGAELSYVHARDRRA